MYADDLVVMSSSARSMQMLLSHCDKYADLHDIIFSTKKSVCMCVKPKCISMYVNQQLTLSSQMLKYVPSHNYLGVTIAANMSDDESIHYQCKALYARGNVILRHFRMCSDEVKCLLFSSYCTSFYCSVLWCRYNADSFNRLHTAYNRVFRQLFLLRGHCTLRVNM